MSGSKRADLSEARLSNYLLGIVGDHVFPADESTWIERLTQLGFMVESEDAGPAAPGGRHGRRGAWFG